MSYWTIPHEMQAIASRKTAPKGKKQVLLNLALPFVLAGIGIPVYIFVLLKFIQFIG